MNKFTIIFTAAILLNLAWFLYAMLGGDVCFQASQQAKSDALENYRNTLNGSVLTQEQLTDAKQTLDKAIEQSRYEFNVFRGCKNHD